MLRKYNFALALGVFVSIRVQGPAPVKDQPDPPTEEALDLAAQALARQRVNPKTISAADALARTKSPHLGEPYNQLWYDPPLFIDAGLG